MKKNTADENRTVGNKSFEEQLHDMANTGDEMASCALCMANRWPRPAVRQRELPVFAIYYFGQRHLCIASILEDSPPWNSLELGEPVYDKWSLALWFAQKGHAIREEPFVLPYHDRIPNCWFMPDDAMRHCQSNLNAYEVVLHRKAEDGDILAQNLLLLAVHWGQDFVSLEDLEEFSDGLIEPDAFMAWSDRRGTAVGQGVSGAFYDKWELIFWLYESIDRLPATLFGLSRGVLVFPEISLEGIFSATDKGIPDPFGADFWDGVDNAAFGLSLEGLGWANPEIKAIYQDSMRHLIVIRERSRSFQVERKGRWVGKLKQGEARMDLAMSEGTRVVSMMADKIHAILGHDVLKAFRQLIRGGADVHALGSREMEQWFVTLAHTVPMPLSVWNRLM